MDELEFIRIVSEIVKQSIKNNSNFSEWEKWWRIFGVEQTKLAAEQYYEWNENQDSK